MADPTFRCLALHTGGSCWIDVTVAVGPRSGPLIRWLGAGWGLELGVGLAVLLEELGAAQLPDGRQASAFWLAVSGERPAGTSADLVLAAATLLRAQRGAQASLSAPDVVVTGSGTLALSEEGRAVAAAVEGWPEKIAALAARLAAEPAPGVLLLHPPEQAAEVTAALQAAGLSAVQPVPVADGSTLLRGLSPLLPAPTWRPEGWPMVSPELARALDRAITFADQSTHGHVGVEHLALALMESAVPGPYLDLLRFNLTRAMLLASLPSPPGGDTRSAPIATPRLERLGEALMPAQDLEGVAAALLQDPSSPLHAVAGRLLSQSLRYDGGEHPFATLKVVSQAPAQFEGALEVVRGPEDGRRLELQPDQTLGRWAPEGAPTLALYQHTRVKDRQLSRVHLRYDGYGQMTAIQPVQVSLAGRAWQVAPGQSFHVEPGTLLRLTPLSWLYALPDTAQRQGT